MTNLRTVMTHRFGHRFTLCTLSASRCSILYDKPPPLPNFWMQVFHQPSGWILSHRFRFTAKAVPNLWHSSGFLNHEHHKKERKDQTIWRAQWRCMYKTFWWWSELNDRGRVTKSRFKGHIESLKDRKIAISTSLVLWIHILLLISLTS